MSQTPAHPRTALLLDFSVEISGKDLQSLAEARTMIPPGTRVNITFIGNEDMELRIEAARAAKDMGLEPVPHIAARRLGSRAELKEFLTRLDAVGATEKIFVVGGDPATPAGPYASAADIITTGILADYGVREVSIAGYPDGHPDIPRADLWNQLEYKTAAVREQGLQAVILTQFTFDVAPVMTWINEVRDRGIDADIRVGTPGPAGIRRLIGYARRFGVGTNASIVRKYGFSLTNLLGTAGPDRFIDDLSEMLIAKPAGTVKLHFYTFGGLRATAEWAASSIERTLRMSAGGADVPDPN